MSQASNSKPQVGSASRDGFDFLGSSDEERFKRYCELRDERYRELVKSLEVQVRILEEGIRWVNEESAR